MDTTVGITEFRSQAKRLVDQLTPSQDVVVLRHNRPVAVLVHPERLGRLLERIEDLEDTAAIAQAADEAPIPYEQHRQELDLDDLANAG